MTLKLFWFVTILLIQSSFISAVKILQERGLARFEAFINEYNKTYNNVEKLQRLDIFMENLEKIKDLNERDPHATFDVNKFSDLSSKEFHEYYTGAKPISGFDSSECTKVTHPRGHNAPESLDWRSKGIVSPVKMQGICRSSWAFAVTGVLESRYAMKYQEIVDLSEQEVVDCDNQSYGCVAGYLSSAFSTLILLGGINLEDDYPYRARQGACVFDVNRVVAKVTDCKTYNVSEDDLKQIVFEDGPIAVYIDGTNLEKYHGGIFSECTPTEKKYMAVVLIGYGTENGVPFWLMKNSWGTNWGESGFFRLKRNVTACFIAQPYQQTSGDIA